MLHLLIVNRLLWFKRADVSMTGMSPSLSGLGINYELMDTDAVHAYNDSHIDVIQLGQRMAWL
jgi:hypothetical protein